MLTLQRIRKDLRDIRYYYSKQKDFDKAAPIVGKNSVLDKVSKYNKAVRDAPARLYDVYVSLYVNNNTQDALAYDWDCTDDYIRQLNKQLCVYFLNTLYNNTD